MASQDVQAIIDQLMPVLRAAIQASVAEAVARSNLVRVITGTLSSVSGADAVWEPDDAPGTYPEATITNASDQTAGARVVVLTIGQGTSYVIGVIP